MAAISLIRLNKYYFTPIHFLKEDPCFGCLCNKDFKFFKTKFHEMHYHMCPVYYYTCCADADEICASYALWVLKGMPDLQSYKFCTLGSLSVSPLGCIQFMLVSAVCKPTHSKMDLRT